MAENTKIEWATHTMNFWTGCQEITPACDFCYARDQWAKRAGRDFHERRRTTPENWKKPLKWNAAASAVGVRDQVFTNSLSDFCDNHVPPHWRTDACGLILDCPALDWLILTKRPQNVPKQMPGWMDNWPAHAWIGASAGMRVELTRNLRHLRAIPARIRFLSLEPLLEDMGDIDLTGISWVIVGGESGPNARPMHPDWARSLRDQCAAADVPFFFKQWGEWAPGECANGRQMRTERTATWWDGKWDFATQTPSETANGHVDDEPDLYRLGKHAAGAHLDGALHRAMPEGL